MTKMSPNRKASKGIPLAEKRRLSPTELTELHEMVRVINQEKFKASQIKANSALVPRGQEVAAEIEAIARLLDNVKNGYVAQKLIDCGYKQDTICDINLSTGEITEKK